MQETEIARKEIEHKDMESLLKCKEHEISELQNRLLLQQQHFLEMKSHHETELLKIEKQCNDVIKNLAFKSEALKSEKETLISKNRALSCTLGENLNELKQVKKECDDLEKNVLILKNEKDVITNTLTTSYKKMLETSMVECQKQKEIEKNSLIVHYGKVITELQTTNEKMNSDMKKQSQLMRRKEKKVNQLLQVSHKEKEDAIVELNTALSQLKQYNMLEQENVQLKLKVTALQNNATITEKQAINYVDSLRQKFQGDRLLSMHKQIELESSLSKQQQKIDELLGICCQPRVKLCNVQNRTALSNSPPSLFSLAIKKIEYTRLQRPCMKLVKKRREFMLNPNKSHTSFIFYIVCVMVIYLFLSIYYTL